MVLCTLEEEIMARLEDSIDPPYLDAMAELIKHNKQRTYTWMHIQPGHSVLDVGCGPGIDTIALAKLVGPSGSVIGVDVDEAMIAEADRRAEQARCRAWCCHQQGDATALSLETGMFDSCRSERLFQYVHNPADVLAEMARVTKPGGWVVILDADHGTWSIDTPELDIERRLVRVLAERMVNNGYAGRQLYALFKRQQFADINVEIRPLYFTNYTQFRYGIQLDIIEREALAAGCITEEELNRWQQNLEEAETTGTFFAHAAGVLVAGRKAESSSS
jgi:ubiquinone/menaquinone biosynthesis C-methylase UbiE